MTPTAAKTARHFEEGARVVHSEYGLGAIRNGRPEFDNGAIGTTMTRLRPAPEPAPEPEGFTCRCCGSDVPTPFPVDFCGWCRGSAAAHFDYGTF